MSNPADPRGGGTEAVTVLVRAWLREGGAPAIRRAIADTFERIREEPACDTLIGHFGETGSPQFMAFEEWRDIDEFVEFVGNREYMREYFARTGPHVLHADRSLWTRIA